MYIKNVIGHSRIYFVKTSKTSHNLLTIANIGNRLGTMLPNIYRFPLTGLPENESYSEHGDYHTSNFF